MPEDAGALLQDPKFLAPGRGGVGLDSLEGYRPHDDSPCRGKGLPIDDLAEHDFWGKPLAKGEKLIGA